MSPRDLWALVEPVHSVTYFAPEAHRAYGDVGVRGFWRGYFAGRAAPLGPVGPATVTALFAGFAPAMVERALPALWEVVTPEGALAARLDGAVAALRVLTPDLGTAVVEAAPLLREVAGHAETSGRALGAANAGLPWPEEPYAALWHAATVLRELRGDGHVAAQVAAGLSGLSTMVLRSGHDLDRSALQPHRGWTDDEWSAAAAGLADRGLLDEAGRATDEGVALVAHLEDVTEALAAQPWRAVGDEATRRTAEVLRPVAVAAAQVMPAVTPIGVLPRL